MLKLKLLLKKLLLCNLMFVFLYTFTYAGIRIPDTTNCDTLDTDGTGIVSCGTDDDVPEVGDFDALDGGRSLTYDTGGNQMNADSELYTTTKCIIIETPLDADNFIWFYAKTAITITDIDCICEDATSVVIDVQECDSAADNCATVDATITCDVNGAADDGSLSNGAIDATDWLRLDIGTITGTPGHVVVCITFTWND